MLHLCFAAKAATVKGVEKSVYGIYELCCFNNFSYININVGKHSFLLLRINK